MIFDIVIIIFLMLVAIILLLAEIFLLPGITIACIGSVVFAIGGAVYAYSIDATTGHITIVSTILAFAIAFLWLMRSKSFNKVALKTDVDSKLTSSRELGIEPGDEGVTLSRLAPIGKADVKGITVEAKSTGEFIDEDTEIVVVSVEGYNVIVEEKK